MMDYEAAAIHLWYQDGNRNKFKDATETTREFYLDRARAIIEAAVGDKVLYEKPDKGMSHRHREYHDGWLRQFYPEVKE